MENGDNNPDNYNNCSEEYSNECQNQYHDNDYSNQYYNEDDGGGGQQMNYSEKKGPEILYKSSKELYKAVAKQCGISCKMTDTCRQVYLRHFSTKTILLTLQLLSSRLRSCVDCQSRYFDCEFDQNDNEKSDGGLGAGNGAINYGIVYQSLSIKLRNKLSSLVTGTPMFVNEVLHGTACIIL